MDALYVELSSVSPVTSTNHAGEAEIADDYLVQGFHFVAEPETGGAALGKSDDPIEGRPEDSFVPTVGAT